MMNRRDFLLRSAASVTATSLFAGGMAYSVAATAASDASQPLRLVVPFPPGGGGDVLARSVADTLTHELGRKIWIDNRPGAGGTIGARRASQAPADGGTICYVTNGILCVNPILYKDVVFDPLASLEPIGQISQIGLIGVLNPAAIEGVKDLDSLIAYAKANPRKLNFASSGSGTTSHMAGLFFAEEAGVELTHIPYKGGAPAILDVLSGRIPFMIDVAPNVIEHVRAGKLVALGASTKERLAIAPEVPTFMEQGLKGFELAAWDGLMGPKGLASDFIKEVNEALQKTLKNQTLEERLGNKGAQTTPGKSEEFLAFIKSEQPKWAKLVGMLNAQAD